MGDRKHCGHGQEGLRHGHAVIGRVLDMVATVEGGSLSLRFAVKTGCQSSFTRSGRCGDWAQEKYYVTGGGCPGLKI